MCRDDKLPYDKPRITAIPFTPAYFAELSYQMVQYYQ
jgi:hypothetical protein